MRLLMLCTLLAIAAGINGLNFKIEGHSTIVEPGDVENNLSSRSLFASFENKIETRLRSLLNNDLDQFVIERFEIHGDARSKQSAIFHAYLSTTKSTEQLIELVNASEDTTFFHILPIDSIPNSPSEDSGSFDAGVNSCQNGGILLPNKTCACPGFYKGLQCETIECLHHGVQDGNRCSCPPGVYAINCESRSCSPAIQQNLDTTQSSFIVVVNQKISMSYALNQIIVNIGKLVNEINGVQSPPIQNYVIVNYVTSKTATYIQSHFYTDSTSFLNYVNGIVGIDGITDQPTTQAIAAAQTNFPLVNPFTNIFVFTDAPDSDATPVSYSYSSNSFEMEVIQHSIAWRHRIILIILQTDAAKIDTYGDYYDVYRRLAKSTIGDLIVADMLEIDNVLDKLLYYYRKIETVAARYGASSATPSTINIVTLGDQVHYHAIITVEPNGTLPTLNAGVVPELQGKRFTLVRSWTSIIPSLTLTGGTQWSIRVFVQSTATAILAYDTNPQIDVGSLTASAELPGEISTAAVIGFDGLIMVSTFDLSTGNTTGAEIGAQTRANECAFPLLFPYRGSSCTPGPYGNLVKLTLLGGQPAHRVIPGFCGILDHHDPVPFKCLNGGTKAGFSTCRCTPSFEGPNCGTPVCQNGGTPDKFPGNGRGLCICPFGYSGDFCEVLSCMSPSPDNFNTFNRTLALVLQNSMSQAQVNSKINSGVAALLNLMKQASSFNEYVVSTFNSILVNGNSTPVSGTSRYSSSSAFQAAILSDNLGYKASSATTQDSLKALYSAMYGISYAKSSIFLFVDAPPTPGIRVQDVVLLAIQKQLQINIVITPPFQMTGLCMNATASAPFVRIAQQTGGIMVNLCNSYGTYNQDPITQLFIGYGSTHHHVENINEYHTATSNMSIAVPFVVDDPTTSVYVFVNSDVSEKFTIQLVNNDYPTNLITLTSIVTMPFLGVYQVTPDYSNIKGYVLNVVAANGSTTGQLIARVVEKTSLSTTLRFSPDPSTDSYANAIFYASPVSPVIHVSSVFQTQPTVSVVAVHDQYLLYNSIGQVRSSSCRYEFYFPDKFTCGTLYEPFILDIKVQAGNRTIQRAERAYCYLQANQCLNGGTSVNGTCSCASGYTGPYCETSVCLNGGVSANFGCQCTSSYIGPQCQYAVCNDWNYIETQDARTQNFKQVTFVLNSNKNQALTNILLSQYIADFVTKTDADGIPKQYSLITFDEYGSSDIVSTSHGQTFVNSFQNQVRQITNSEPAEVPAVDALLEAYKLSVEPPTIIFLFLGSDVSRGTSLTKLSQQKSGTQVNVIYTPNDAPLVQPGYLLGIPVRQSLGRMLPITPMSVASLENVLLSAMTENALIHDDAAKDCTGGTTFIFNVEANAQSVVLDITGADVSAAGGVVITDAKGVSVPVLPSNILFTDSAAIVLSIPASTVSNMGGAWTVVVTTTSSSCYLQARANSPLHVVAGFTSDLNSDFPKALLFSEFATNKTTYMTFRIPKPMNAMAGATVTKLSIYKEDYDQPWSSFGLLHTLDVNPRNSLGCSYQFISQSWTVDRSTYQKYVAEGSDGMGSTWQRTFFYTTKADATATCVNGTRNAFGECECSLKYFGDYCSQARCQNGGTPSYGICVCNDGYYGTFCEKYLPNSMAASTSMGPATTSSKMTTKPITTGSPSVSSTPALSTKNTPQTTPPSTQPTTRSNTAPITQPAITTKTSTKPTTGTTTPLPCDPGSTTYLFSFFVDVTGPAFAYEDLGQTALIDYVAQVEYLGGGASATRFLIGGVSDNYYSSGTNITQPSQLSAAYDAIAPPNQTYSLQLDKAIATYFKSDISKYSTTENPPFAVLFFTRSVLGGQGVLRTQYQTLTSKGYHPIAVDRSYEPTVATDLKAVFGAADYVALKNVEDTANFIRNRACSVKPV